VDLAQTGDQFGQHLAAAAQAGRQGCADRIAAARFS
jgi:hypothetical protein